MPWAVLLPKRRAKRKCLLKEIIHSISSSHEYCTWAILIAKKLLDSVGELQSPSAEKAWDRTVSRFFFTRGWAGNMILGFNRPCGVRGWWGKYRFNIWFKLAYSYVLWWLLPVYCNMQNNIAIYYVIASGRKCGKDRLKSASEDGTAAECCQSLSGLKGAWPL